MFMWPTSELPICPAGRPTASPDAISWACGYRDSMASYTGVRAMAIALLVGSSRVSQPASTSRTRGFVDAAIALLQLPDGALSCVPPGAAELFLDWEELVGLRNPIGPAPRAPRGVS